MHQLPKRLQADSSTIFHFSSSWLCFSTWMLICFSTKWQRTSSCASLSAWSAALLTSSCDVFHPDLCSFNQQYHDVKLLATLCTKIAMRQEVSGVRRGGRADLSTPALHPSTPKNVKPRAALLTSLSCPDTTKNCLLYRSVEGKIVQKIRII